jgi:CrcB protein
VTVLLVALGAGVGAGLRYLTASRLDRGWHLGTLLVNVVGSFVLGLCVGAGVDGDLLALLGTGLCGGLTTYSAFAVQSHDVGRRSRTRAAAYVAATLVGCVAACAVGYATAA